MFFRSKNPTDALTAIDARKVELSSQRNAVRVALDAAQAREIAAIIEGTPVDATECALLLHQIELVDSALAAIDTERPLLLAASERQRAAELRDQARVKRSEAAALVEKAQKLLPALSSLLGVVYDCRVLGTQPIGPWNPSYRTAAVATDYQMLGDFGSPDPGNHRSIAIPKHRLLFDEAVELENRAHLIDMDNPLPATTDVAV